MSKRREEKMKALREHSSLNPRPDRVTDALFEQDDFFDARDLVQVKYEMLRRAREEQGKISEIAARFGFSRPSFYKLKAALEKEGLAGLMAKKRGPRRRHKVSDEVLSFLEDLQQSQGRLSHRRMAKRVREDLNIKAHPTSIGRGLKAGKKKPR
jgi:transposase